MTFVSVSSISRRNYQKTARAVHSNVSSHEEKLFLYCCCCFYSIYGASNKDLHTGDSVCLKKVVVWTAIVAMMSLLLLHSGLHAASSLLQDKTNHSNLFSSFVHGVCVLCTDPTSHFPQCMQGLSLHILEPDCSGPPSTCLFLLCPLHQLKLQPAHLLIVVRQSEGGDYKSQPGRSVVLPLCVVWDLSPFFPTSLWSGAPV